MAVDIDHGRLRIYDAETTVEGIPLKTWLENGLVDYRQNVEVDMIGGDQCHLCGAHVIFESYQKFYKRKTGRIKATRDLKEYACGTIVINGEDGDSYEPWKLDTLGERCLESKFI